MILITMILITMDFMVLGGTVGAVDGGEDPVVGTMDEEEEDIEVEGVMDLMDPMEEVLVDPMEEDLVEVVEAWEEAVVVAVEEVVVNHTSMIFLTYSQTLCTCQLTDLNSHTILVLASRSFGFPQLVCSPSDSHTILVCYPYGRRSNELPIAGQCTETQGSTYSAPPHYQRRTAHRNSLPRRER